MLVATEIHKAHGDQVLRGCGRWLPERSCPSSGLRRGKTTANALHAGPPHSRSVVVDGIEVAAEGQGAAQFRNAHISKCLPVLAAGSTRWKMPCCQRWSAGAARPADAAQLEELGWPPGRAPPSQLGGGSKGRAPRGQRLPFSPTRPQPRQRQRRRPARPVLRPTGPPRPDHCWSPTTKGSPTAPIANPGDGLST